MVAPIVGYAQKRVAKLVVFRIAAWVYDGCYAFAMRASTVMERKVVEGSEEEGAEGETGAE